MKVKISVGIYMRNDFFSYFVGGKNLNAAKTYGHAHSIKIIFYAINTSVLNLLLYIMKTIKYCKKSPPNRAFPCAIFTSDDGDAVNFDGGLFYFPDVF